jgi:hypothetical protein
MGLNDFKDESEVHPRRLPDKSVQEDAEPEAETDDSKRIH